ncbi:MAG: glutathione S-transferase family protein [Myxococcota bacterium]
MGLLIDGQWHDRWYDTKSTGGRFKRQDSKFRNWVTPDGSPGPSGEGGFKAESGRYHLYVSYACPWAHRTLIYRSLKGLQSHIGLSVVHWLMGENGWTFDDGPGVIKDPNVDARFIYNVYQAADPKFTGRTTVPVLWDKERHTIVSNESSEIIRMFNSAFDELGATPADFLPEAHREEIDQLNARIYDTVNNGVYKCGFATSQEAYDEAIGPLFDTLDHLEERLETKRYLLGSQPTEADWRFLTTLLRFDLVYYGHFKCNIRRIADYKNLWAYTRDLYQYPGVRETFNMEHAQKHYYQSHETINPTRIVPRGPQLDFGAPHHRESLG